VKGIADTGFLVAFAKRRDQYHSWAVSLAKGITEPLLSCEAVLAEAAFHLESSSTVLAMVRDGLVTPALNVNEHLDRLAELAARYTDRKPDLADLCLIRLSELHPTYPVITTDLADFSVYRRGRRDVIPLIHPPGRHRRRDSHM
jgi:predicted nucleic acid-binding protein